MGCRPLPWRGDLLAQAREGRAGLERDDGGLHQQGGAVVVLRLLRERRRPSRRTAVTRSLRPTRSSTTGATSPRRRGRSRSKGTANRGRDTGGRSRTPIRPSRRPVRHRNRCQRMPPRNKPTTRKLPSGTPTGAMRYVLWRGLGRTCVSAIPGDDGFVGTIRAGKRMTLARRCAGQNRRSRWPSRTP